MKRRINKIHKCGFTLVELLTTLAVIGVLLGLLIPALNQVSKSAAKIKQKAQFHSIGLALEAFRNDYGDYPPSVWDDTDDGIGTYYGKYSASQRLAEALVGRDGLGFHPNSRFYQNGRDAAGNPLYYPAFAPADTAEEQANLTARKGPYLELENANAVKLDNLDSLMSSLVYTNVLVDNYKIIKNKATGRDVGMPILYYRANRLKIGNDPAESEWPNNTYNFQDSYCEGLGFVNSLTVNGTYTEAAEAFYKTIKNPNFTNPERPYRAESFLLQSAGPDGLYGTADDIFNFDQEN